MISIFTIQENSAYDKSNVFAKINVIDFNLFVQIVNGSRSTKIKDVSCIGVPFPTVPGNNLEIIQ